MNEQGNGPSNRFMQELGDPFASDSAVTPHALAPSFNEEGRLSRPLPDTDRDLTHSDVHALQDVPFHSPDAHDPFAQFDGPSAQRPFAPDGAIPGEATQIDEEHLIAEESTTILGETPEPVYLSVEAGKDQGKRFTLLHGSTSIGRSIDNDVILTDISVSRKHLRIDLRGNELRVIDLRSGNGSLLNGGRVDEALLYHNDCIQIGESVLRVDAPSCQRPVAQGAWPAAGNGAAFAQGPPPMAVAPQAGPMGPTTVHVDPILALPPVRRRWSHGRLAALMLVGGLVFTLLGATVTALLLRGRSSVPAEPVMDLANTFNDAQEALRVGQYRAARNGFRHVVAARPTDGSARQGLEAAETALLHKRFVAEAREASSTARWPVAIQMADRVPDGSPVATEAREVASNARERWIGAVDSSARAALAAENLDAARRYLREARDAATDDPRVERLATDVAEAEAAQSSSNPRGATRAEPVAAAPAPRPATNRSTPPPARAAERPTDEPAVPRLTPVLVRRPTPDGAGIDEQVANARDLGTSSTAGCQAVRRALDVDGSHAGARAMFGECVANAERLLASASSRPATAQRHLYLQIMGMVGQSHGLFGRAQRALGELRRDEDE